MRTEFTNLIAHCLLPSANELRLESLSIDEAAQILTLQATSTQAVPACPRSQAPTRRVHSTYTRTLLVLPWADVAVRIHLQVRKCFCSTSQCPGRIFTERLPHLAAPWTRRTRRMADHQRQMGVALGAAAAQRLGDGLQHRASRTTLLRLVRTTPSADPPTPRILGLDDWARRKGHTYGSILVDIERGVVVDLLPDRSAETFAAWLHAHPGVEVISRDRAGTYAEGACQAAPDAIQVADRWHLLKNLGDALVQLFDQHRSAIEQQFTPTARAPTPSAVDASAPTVALASGAPAPDALPTSLAPGPSAERPDRATLVLLAPPSLAPSHQRKQEAQQLRRARRLAQYQEIDQLRRAGWRVSAIAERVGLDRNTVRKYGNAPVFPERQPRAAQSSVLEPYKPYILERWNAGCHTGAIILREVLARGYRGGQTPLLAYITQLRKASGLPPKKRSGGGATPISDPTQRAPSSRSLTWLVLRKADTLEADQQQRLAQLPGAHADIASGITLVQEFATIVREGQGEQQESWQERAAASGLAPRVSFVSGVRRDYAAVKAGVTLQYSKGPTEGQINRLKMVKRQMYGRAKLDLLKQRLMAA